MGAREQTHFVLTIKGTEELAMRTYRLDAKVRNILFLIQKGTPTIEAILQNSIFPHDEVVGKLRDLVRDQFVAVSNNSSAPPATVGRPAAPPTIGYAARPPTLTQPLPASDLARTQTTWGPTPLPTLRSNVSVSHARSLLSDFCLEQFGTKASSMIDAVNAAIDVPQLQSLLDRIAHEVGKRCRDQLPVLTTLVGQINQAAS
jgi:hypothetical protein